MKRDASSKKYTGAYCPPVYLSVSLLFLRPLKRHQAAFISRQMFHPIRMIFSLFQFYHECILHAEDSEKAIEIVKKLPELQCLVLSYLIRFLQVMINHCILQN